VLDDVRLVARTAHLPSDVAEEIVRSLSARLDAVRARVADRPRPRAFCLEWLDPPYTAGHWVPGMVELAGGRDALGTPAGPSRPIAWREVVDYAPEVVVLMPCSLSLERVAAEFAVVRDRPGWWQLPAARSGQVYAGNTHLFSRSGPRLVDGVEALARMLHPEVSGDPLPAGRALKVSADGQRLEPYQ
jgi:iron complex transport system substrate-binding protein